MILNRLWMGLNLARSGIYFLESLPFALVSRWIGNPDLPPPTNEQVRTLWKHIVQLHEREAQNLDRGLYPASALELENPLRHLRSFIEVLRDGVKVAFRMRRRDTKSFSREASDMGEGLPDYYTRNFHFQTDGYLSEASARRYDHQVEILFTGTAGAMRRMILPVLKDNTRGDGHWLEIGCGTGATTRSVCETFPKAKVTALDMSAPYLKIAQNNLRRYQRVDFMQGDGTNLDFKNSTFDVVYSVYLLHELPKPERAAVIREAFRVLKPGGILIFADSTQLGDEKELDWALDRFPKAYHEPFYRNYIENNLAKTLKQATGCEARTEYAFFTKIGWVQKPLSSELS